MPAALFLGIQLVLYIFFMAIDLWMPQYSALSGILKYCGICLCLLKALTAVRSDSKASASFHREKTQLTAALLFTAVSDLLLLFTARFTAGILTFTAAQLMYMFYIHPETGRYLPLMLRRAAPAAAAALILWISAPAESRPLLLPAAVYAVCILCNFLEAAYCFVHNPAICRYRLLAAGFFLFLLCDINVALFNVLPADSFLFPIASAAMWFFYLPSQVCLTLSICYNPA